MLERRDNDKQVEAVRGEADDIERKVGSILHGHSTAVSADRMFKIERQMAAHLKESETEINGLLAQYWKLRHETGLFVSCCLPTTIYSTFAILLPQRSTWKRSQTSLGSRSALFETQVPCCSYSCILGSLHCLYLFGIPALARCISRYSTLESEVPYPLRFIGISEEQSCTLNRSPHARFLYAMILT